MKLSVEPINIRTPPTMSEAMQIEMMLRVMEATEIATGLKYETLTKYSRDKERDITRGGIIYIFFLLNIHPQISHYLLKCTRANVVNMTAKYVDFVRAGDEQTINVINKIIRVLNLKSKDMGKKVFLYYDEERAKQIRWFIDAAFAQCDTLCKLLKSYGVPVTKNVVMDCIRMRRYEEQGTEIPTTEYTMNPDAMKQTRHEVSVRYSPVSWFDIEWDKLTTKRVQRTTAATPREALAVIDEMRGIRTELLDKVCELFKDGQANLGREHLVKCIDIQNEQIVTAGVDEYCEKQSEIFATTEKGMRAKEMQDEIVKMANQIVEEMKPVGCDVRNLFSVNPITYEVTANRIDFDLYFKEGNGYE